MIKFEDKANEEDDEVEEVMALDAIMPFVPPLLYLCRLGSL